VHRAGISSIALERPRVKLRSQPDKVRAQRAAMQNHLSTRLPRQPGGRGTDSPRGPATSTVRPLISVFIIASQRSSEPLPLPAG